MEGGVGPTITGSRFQHETQGPAEPSTAGTCCSSVVCSGDRAHVQSRPRTGVRRVRQLGHKSEGSSRAGAVLKGPAQK